MQLFMYPEYHFTLSMPKRGFWKILAQTNKDEKNKMQLLLWDPGQGQELFRPLSIGCPNTPRVPWSLQKLISGGPALPGSRWRAQGPKLGAGMHR